MGTREHHRIVIVGSGFSGLGAAIRLRQRGLRDFVVLERASDLGGTWRENTYPGIACDVPAPLYSFSFAPNPGWSRLFAGGAEIQDYLQDVATRYGVRPHLRFDCSFDGATWDEAARRWEIETSRGPLSADVLIGGFGPLTAPMVPELPGLARFTGTSFHSADWDHEHDLAGERVAVIGTGASAIQFVPQIQPLAARLMVFQRTPPWVMPRPDQAISARLQRLFGRVPAVQLALRGFIYGLAESMGTGFLHPRLAGWRETLALQYLKRNVPDPDLRAKLTPHYRIGCKRVLFTDAYLPAITQPNVELITDAISEIREHSIVTADGTEHEIDTIIFGTGFHVTDHQGGGDEAPIRGRDGVALHERWTPSARAHLGTTVAGYPNLFLMVGPNTALGHNSIVYMIESQLNLILDAIALLEDHGVATIEPRKEAQQAFNRELDERMRGTVWVDGGCASYYIDGTGHNSIIWPGYTFQYRQATRSLRVADYELGFAGSRGAHTEPVSPGSAAAAV